MTAQFTRTGPYATPGAATLAREYADAYFKLCDVLGKLLNLPVNHSTATLASRTKRSAGISRSANSLQILAAGLSAVRVARPSQPRQQQGRGPTTRQACVRGSRSDNVNTWCR